MPKPEMTPTNIRLALRVEGDKWVAYAAPIESMDGAVWLGSVAMVAVAKPSRKHLFMGLMRDVLDDYIRDMTGTAPRWNEPTRAPERERAGRA